MLFKTDNFEIDLNLHGVYYLRCGKRDWFNARGLGYWCTPWVLAVVLVIAMAGYSATKVQAAPQATPPSPAECLVNDPDTLKAAMLALIDLVLDEVAEPEPPRVYQLPYGTL